MGRYYNGDINGKFWFGITDSGVADNFGQGVEMYYCEARDEDIPEYDIEDLTEEELETLDQEPNSISYDFTFSNFDLERLNELNQQCKKLDKENENLYNEIQSLIEKGHNLTEDDLTEERVEELEDIFYNIAYEREQFNTKLRFNDFRKTYEVGYDEEKELDLRSEYKNRCEYICFSELWFGLNILGSLCRNGSCSFVASYQ